MAQAACAHRESPSSRTTTWCRGIILRGANCSSVSGYAAISTPASSNRRRVDRDPAILLTKARQHGIAPVGPSAAALFEPVPARDFVAALLDTGAQWNGEPDWRDGECNVVLALARFWYSAATGSIAPKDVAAAWVLARLPDAYRPVVAAARDACLGGDAGAAILTGEPLAAFIGDTRRTVETMLRAWRQMPGA